MVINGVQQPKDAWPEWMNHVLFELKRLDSGQEDINDKLTAIQVDIAMLKVKAGLWGGAIGAIAGAIPATIAIIWILITK